MGQQSARRLIAAGLSGFLIVGGAQALYGPALPAFSRDMGFGPGAGGLVISAHWLGAFLGVVLLMAGAPLTARRSLGLVAAGAAAVALAPGLALLLPGAVVLGAGYGALSSLMNRRFMVEIPGGGTGLVGILNASFGFGSILTPLVFIVLGNSASGAFGVLAAGAATVALFADNRPAPRATGAGWRLPSRGLALLAAGGVGIGIEASLVGLGPAALVRGGASDGEAARAATLFFVAFLLARLSLWWLGPRVGPVALLRAAIGASGFFAALAALAFPGAFVLAGAAAALIFPAFFVAATARLGDDQRSAAAIVGIGLLGGMAGPLLVAAAGPSLTFGATALLALAALGASIAPERAPARIPGR